MIYIIASTYLIVVYLLYKLKLEIMRVEDLTFTERRRLVSKLHELEFTKDSTGFYTGNKRCIKFNYIVFKRINISRDSIDIYIDGSLISIHSDLTVIV